MKREERLELLRKEAARCQRDADSVRFFGLATGYDNRANAITETLAELERYRVALRKIADALPGGEEICGIPFACWECDEKSKIASDALVDEEVKPGETPAI